MIIDVSSIILIPGDNGDNCHGNGEHIDKNGNFIECCCDECDYFLKCFPAYIEEDKHSYQGNPEHQLVLKYY